MRLSAMCWHADVDTKDSGSANLWIVTSKRRRGVLVPSPDGRLHSLQIFQLTILVMRRPERNILRPVARWRNVLDSPDLERHALTRHDREHLHWECHSRENGTNRRCYWAILTTQSNLTLEHFGGTQNPLVKSSTLSVLAS